MPEPSSEQLLVLTDTSKIRIVRAVPGSGKTWLIAETMRKELSAWSSKHQGIAALSFTNVAGQEIRKALGAEPGHPHFVGTIDAFVYRYIVRPFISIFDTEIRRPHLVPAELLGFLSNTQHWYDTDMQMQVGTAAQRANPFNINFVEEQNNQPIFSIRLVPGGLPTRLTGTTAQLVLSKKFDIWRKSGRLSHSDAAFLGAQIVTAGEKSQFVCDLIARRFPILIVDELQDTGWFLGQILMRLFSHSACKAIGVGDPDQAIYEFNGARPELFEQFCQLPHAVQFPMETSRRCPKSVCRVAEHLGAVVRSISSQDSRMGRAVLLVHEGYDAQIGELAKKLLAAGPINNLRIVTRTNAIVQRLNGETNSTNPPLRSRPLNHLHKAVNFLRLGQMKKAYSAAEAALARPIFFTDAPIKLDLDKLNIDPFEWRKAVVSLLLRAHEDRLHEDVYDWGCRMREEIKSLFESSGWWKRAPSTKRLPLSPQASSRGIARASFLVTKKEELVPTAIPVQTVHAVKGETHHTTIFYVPRPKSEAACPSRVWWSNVPEGREERRIAFVAATRPSETFILCVHTSTFQRLSAERSEFVDAFEVMQLTDFLRTQYPASSI
jgi:DNA helicase II / ATP-dependent DNA helicase PcrA